MAGTIGHTRSVRAGHKGFVTKKLADLDTALGVSPVDMDVVEQIRTILLERMELLNKLSSDIVALLTDEEEIIAEIDGAEGVNDIIRDALLKIKKATGPEKIPPSSTPTSPRVPKVNLPEFSLQSFDGNYSNWLTFWETYKATIHDNSELTDVLKFTYLLNALRGPAKEAVDGLALTSSNYREAIELLNKRFGDPTQIQAKHMDALMSLDPVTNIHNLFALRRLYDNIETHMRGLKSLGIKSESYGALLSPVVMKKLPTELKIIISRKVGDDPWNLDSILKAFISEVDARERAGVTSQSKPKREREYATGTALPANARHQSKGTGSTLFCCYCRGDHYPSQCESVKLIKERKEILKKQGRCFNCLKRGHLIRECKSSSCKVCKGRHHTSICEKSVSSGVMPEQSINLQVNTPVLNPMNPYASTFFPIVPCPIPSQSSTLCVENDNTVLLQTARATVFNTDYRALTEEVRVIFDCGSQLSYITDSLRERLRVRAEGTKEMSILTFGSAKERNHKCSIIRLGMYTQESNIELRLLSVPYICGPVSSIPVETCKERYDHIRELNLADTSQEGIPEILIGSNYYWNFVTGEKIQGDRGPVAIYTKLGWVLSGPAPLTNGSCDTVNLITHVLRVDAGPSLRDLDRRLKSFWDLESFGVVDSETTGYEQFASNINFKNGRYEVCLPWRDHCSSIPNNLLLSQKRLSSLLRRLKQDSHLLIEYDRVIRQQLDLGIVEIVNNPEEPCVGRVHYLPHHAIIRQEKETTKLRIVYDASAKDRGPSLNDLLYVGPKFHQKILDILLRFRVHGIGLIADVEKAFLMISIAEQDRDVLRFLWVNNIEECSTPFQTLRFTRVVFGVSCSPFLLNATIDYHLNTHLSSSPMLVKKLSRSFYVDDVVTGAHNEEVAFELYSDSKSVLKKGGFNLCKFTTNSPSLQQKIDIMEGKSTDFSSGETYTKTTLNQGLVALRGEKKVLGILWNIDTDEIIYDFSYIIEAIVDLEPTKRKIVSLSGKFYDPLGIIQPVIVIFKIFIQELCRVGVSWDEPLRGELLVRWQLLVKNLRHSQPIRIPRCYSHSFELIDSFQLCGFCDASNAAYAAVVFLLMRSGSEVHARIVASKSRVSPIKTQTIPRLELMGALLLARLIVSVANGLSFELTLLPSICYTDSKITLFWLKGIDKDWKPFVNNRVMEIRKLVPVEYWYHCPGRDNPADAPSRGMSPLELSRHLLWWKGPSWLGLPCEEADNEIDISDDCLKELKSVQQSKTLLISNENKISNIMNITDYSTLNKLLRVTSLLVLFGRRLRGKIPCCDITVSILKEAEHLWIIDTQKELLTHKDYNVLKQQLQLFTDDNGILRCGGRLVEADLPYSTKHPIALPRDSYFTRLVVLRAHGRVLHNGVKETLTEVRARYWVLRGRASVKQIISKCVICRRYEGLPYRAPPPPPFPSFRVTEKEPFTFTGVDYAGPLTVKPDHPINAPCTQKVWIAIYTCCSTRAVHIDVVTNLSCLSFIRSFKRFTSRRGLPYKMISDNGSTFTSASKIIRKIVSDPIVSNHLSGHRVEWVHNLEKAPWWGGIFERVVGMTKRCLRKIVGRAKFSYDELVTVLTEIESILNSRPLSFVSSTDLDEPLTPFHLLHGRRLSNLPDELYFRNTEKEYTIESTPSLLTRRWRYLQRVLDRFWDRWKKEYLINLRERYYRDKQSPRLLKVNVGDIVIVHTEQEARGNWRFGRVEELITGLDGNVRGAVVYTHTGGDRPSLLRRPLQKLYPLETIQEKDTHNSEETISTDTPTSLTGTVPLTDDHLNSTCTSTPSLSRETIDRANTSLQRNRPRRIAAQEARDRVFASLLDD